MGKLFKDKEPELFEELLEYEQEAIALFEKAHPEYQLIETDKDTDSIADGMLIKDGKIVGIVENKVRFMTEEKLQEYESIILKFHQMAKLQQVSRNLRVPLFYLVYLEPDKKLYVWQVTDENGAFNFELKARSMYRKAYKSSKRGNRRQVNAFVPIELAKEIISDDDN